jgi:hypothetical protein
MRFCCAARSIKGIMFSAEYDAELDADLIMGGTFLLLAQICY